MLLPSVPLDAIRLPALLYDAGGRVVAANDRVEALAGRTLVGASIAEIRDAFRQRMPGGAALALDELPASRALRGEEAVGVPLEITAADAQTVPVLATASPLWAGDAVTGALVVWQDVSGLVESEVKYRTLFDSIDEGFFLVDVIFDEQDRPVDLLYVEANAAAVRMLGQDWTGRRLTELSPDYERYWFEIFGKVARTGERVRLERYAAPDRTWYDFSVFRVGGPESRRVGNTFLDITERKRAEAALADSEAKYRQLFESLTEGLIVLEPILDEDGVPASFRWLDANPAFERLTPLTLDEIIGRDAREALPALAPYWVETLARVAETGEPAQGEIHDPDYGGWYSVYAFRPMPGRVAVLLSNVTERRESEERFRSVLDHSLDALYRLNLLTGRYEYISPAFERVVGRSAEEMGSQAAEEAMGWIHPDDLPMVAAGLACLEETGSAEVEYRLRDRDGRYRWISNHLSLVRDESGRPLYRDGVVRDVTAQKGAEQALAASEARYRELFESMTEGFALCEIVLDDAGRPVDYRFLAVNPAFEAMTGFAADMAVGRRISELQPGLQPVWIERYGRVALACTPERFVEYSVPLGRWFDVYAFSPAPGRFASLFRDVTEERQAGEALAESEEQHRRLFETMLQGVIYQDTDGRIVSMNPAAERILGKSAEEFLGSSSIGEEHDTIRDDGTPLPGLEHPSMVALRTGAEVRDVVMGVYNPREGDYRWISITAVPLVREGEAAPYQVYTIFDDVTERTEMERALRESEALLSRVLELSLDGIYRRDLVTGRYEYANPALASITGYPLDELLRMDLDAIRACVHPDDVAFMREAFRTPDGWSGKGEFRFRCRDGTYRWLSEHVTVEAGDDGRPQSVTGVVRDMTEQREKDEALRQSESKYRSLFDSLDDGFCIIEVLFDESGTPVDYVILEANPAFMKQTGLADVIGKRMRDLEPAHEEHWFQIYGEIARTGEHRRFIQAAMPLISGWYEVYAFPSGAPGSNRVAILFTDITERKKAEETLLEYARDLERSNEDLERFAYVASHDLQEPLRPIVSFSQLLERRYKGRLDADADDYIDFIVEGGNRMQTLIQDLLAYWRANSMPLERRPTDVEAVVASVERSLDHQLQEAGAVITRDPLPTVTVDPLQLEQVFTNLVSNVIKFRRPDVPLRVHVGVRREDDSWEFSVTDNGIGIEEEYFDQLFVIFKRLHTRDTYPGTGIGLPIVKRIIDRHGGRVRVESVPGEGSTFFFTLPAP